MRSPRVFPEHPVPLARQHGLGVPLSKVGFPIRKSADQSFFAAPRGLSQRSTSFIASQRQGIHRMPLRHLIALIINAHAARQRPTRSSRGARAPVDSSPGRTLIRKTSLLRIVPTACGQAADMAPRQLTLAQCSEIAYWPTFFPSENVSVTRRFRHETFTSQDGPVTTKSRSDPTSSRCQISRTRIDDARPLGPRGFMAGAEFVSLRTSRNPTWWSQTGSNRRPPACKAGALPTELWPRTERGKDGGPGKT
jgi:hypothetical protein